MPAVDQALVDRAECPSDTSGEAAGTDAADRMTSALCPSPRGETMRLSNAFRISAAVVLAASATALAQSDDKAGRAAPPPARVGNIYDHKAHQPTEADVPRTAGSGSSQQQVEKEVQDLLRQTDELDKQAEERERIAPAGRPGTR